jgi:hypothetical protein
VHERRVAPQRQARVRGSDGVQGGNGGQVAIVAEAHQRHRRTLAPWHAHRDFIEGYGRKAEPLVEGRADF